MRYVCCLLNAKVVILDTITGESFPLKDLDMEELGYLKGLHSSIISEEFKLIEKILSNPNYLDKKYGNRNINSGDSILMGFDDSDRVDIVGDCLEEEILYTNGRGVVNTSPILPITVVNCDANKIVIMNMGKQSLKLKAEITNTRLEVRYGINELEISNSRKTTVFLREKDLRRIKKLKAIGNIIFSIDELNNNKPIECIDSSYKLPYIAVRCDNFSLTNLVGINIHANELYIKGNVYNIDIWFDYLLQNPKSNKIKKIVENGTILMWLLSQSQEVNIRARPKNTTRVIDLKYTPSNMALLDGVEKVFAENPFYKEVIYKNNILMLYFYDYADTDYYKVRVSVGTYDIT